jgi:hypothetical protein
MSVSEMIVIAPSGVAALLDQRKYLGNNMITCIAPPNVAITCIAPPNVAQNYKANPGTKAR